MTDTNRVRERFAAGERVVGPRLRTFDPAMIEVYGELGFDFVWLDFEHAGPSPADSRRMEAFTRAADAADVELVPGFPPRRATSSGRSSTRGWGPY